MASPKKSQPAAPRRFRDKWPFITWYAPRECYVVDTRVGGQGVGGKRHFCKTLAEAENIATAAANLRDAHGTASYHNDELAQYGLTIQDAVTAQLKLLRAARAPKPLQEALEEFRESKLKEGLRPNSLKAVIWEITRVVNELGPATSVGDLTIAMLENYLGTSQTPGTFNTRRKHLVTFLNFALKRGWIEKNHALNIGLRIERYEDRPRRVRRYPTRGTPPPQLAGHRPRTQHDLHQAAQIFSVKVAGDFSEGVRVCGFRFFGLGEGEVGFASFPGFGDFGEDARDESQE
jgi:hypothetical protein